MSYSGPLEQGISNRAPWTEGGAVYRDSSRSLISDPGEQLPVQPLTGQLLRERKQVLDLEISAATRTALLRCRAIADLEQFDFPELADLCASLRVVASFDSARVRLARAVRAGLSAKDKLTGRIPATVASLPLAGFVVNKWYICLRCPKYPSGFLTQDYRRYIAEVQDRHHRFHPQGVSHSFGSLEEVAVYLAGAQHQWPADHLQ